MRKSVLLATALAAVTGCGSPAGAAGSPGPVCTEIGARAGIGVEVAAPLAARAREATLVACWDGTCRTRTVRLTPSTTVGDTTCAGDRPEDVCSAPAHLTGGGNGFADLPELPELPVSVAFTLTGGDGGTLAEHKLDVTPQRVSPNGPDCPSAGPQANLVVDSRGVVRES